MTIAEEKDVFIFPVHGKLRIVVHDLKIQRGKEIRAAQRAAGMTTGSAMNHSENIPADLRSNSL